MIADLISIVLLAGGCFFFIVGTVGLLRFGDVRTRLHALTKADTLGLGLVCLGLVPQVGPIVGAKLILIWLLALAAAAVIASLLASEVRPSREETRDG